MGKSFNYVQRRRELRRKGLKVSDIDLALLTHRELVKMNKVVFPSTRLRIELAPHKAKDRRIAEWDVSMRTFRVFVDGLHRHIASYIRQVGRCVGEFDGKITPALSCAVLAVHETRHRVQSESEGIKLFSEADAQVPGELGSVLRRARRLVDRCDLDAFFKALFGESPEGLLLVASHKEFEFDAFVVEYLALEHLVGGGSKRELCRLLLSSPADFKTSSG